jgi:hypothetical protein
MATSESDLTATGGISQPLGLLKSLSALRNIRASITVLSAGFMAGLLATWLASLVGSGAGIALIVLLAWLVLLGGINAAGLHLMDQICGVPPRSLINALILGFLCIPKQMAAWIVFLLVVVAVFLVLAILFYVAKIPGIGPVLYVVIYPVAVVVAGATLVGLLVSLWLSLPGFWQGKTLTQTIVEILAIARKRLVEAVLMFLLASLLTLLVAIVIGGVLGVGYWPVLGLAGSIIGPAAVGKLGILSLLAGSATGEEGHAVAVLIGSVLLLVVVYGASALVGLSAACMVYLRLTEGLDTRATERVVAARLEGARRRASEMAERTRQAAERVRQQAQTAAHTTEPPLVRAKEPATEDGGEPAPRLTKCRSCDQPMPVEDVFCISCGAKQERSSKFAGNPIQP